ncbi:MAG: MFS transporter [Candidatus Binatia bacterium]|nr:MFS transporter [Candidatus Binatia bacterium]
MTGRRLGAGSRTIYALGDTSTNTALTALTMIYATFFLTQVAGLRPVLAGAVPLVGRFVDAISDPLIGRLSDRTNFGGARRRPYFLIGAIPFGLSFAMLWIVPDVESQLTLFLYYSFMYSLVSITSTVCSVPYLALIPEMATDYDDRTSLNTYRSVGATVGIFCAIGMRGFADSLGGGPEGWGLAAAIYGGGLALPWFWVYRVSFERPEFRREEVQSPPLITSLLSALRNRTFARLVSLYVCGRLAMDLVGAMLILYFTYWLGRTEDFEVAMLVFLLAAVFGLPFWFWVSKRVDKKRTFMMGALLWTTTQLSLFLVSPDWPRWVGFAGILFAGFGFAAVDIMPWSMVGDVIDEDDLETGERREGLYNGLLMFLRKLAGAVAVFLALALLDFAGFQDGQEQSPSVLLMIRLLASLGPALFLFLGFLAAIRYPLTRERHAEVLAALESRVGRQ